MKTSELKRGMKVHYIPPHKHYVDQKEEAVAENGIFKGHSSRDGFVFVVFNCGGDWKNYHQYTGASCDVSRLHKGWKDQPEPNTKIA